VYSNPDVVAATLQAIGANAETTGEGSDSVSMIEASPDTCGSHDEYAEPSWKRTRVAS
jgi:hypothetical protein